MDPSLLPSHPAHHTIDPHKFQLLQVWSPNVVLANHTTQGDYKRHLQKNNRNNKIVQS